MSHVMHTYARLPVAFERGEGVWLFDEAGRRYLDALAGIAVNTLGHNHPRLVRAIAEQAGRVIHTSNLYRVPRQEALGDRLAALSGMSEAFFCNSGCEANEAAIKLARKYSRDTFGPERYEIITAAESFHGRTMATVSATGQEKVQKFFDPLLHGFRHVPFNDPAALAAAITPNTCAVMLEPIQGEGGVNVPDPGYFREVRRLCDEHRLLLIFDEVQVGMGRTGTLFAYEHFGVTPDIMTLAKALAGGAPIGTMLARERYAAAFTPGTHGSTFGGNPLVTAAALATVRTILEEGLLNRTEEIGEYLVGELERLKERFPFVREVRGIGLMIGMSLTIPGGDIVRKGHERGVLLNVTHDTVLRFVPPLVVTKQEIDRMIAVLTGIFTEQLEAGQ
jgi:acetylornithine/N-succinyldiaminopimelate aminotransferase